MSDLKSPANFHWHDRDPGPELFSHAVLEGLGRTDKAVPFRFLYDKTGSDLFEQICRQPEYYITRTELCLLEDKAAEIADIAGPSVRLVEFGSGESRKGRLLLEALEDPAAYIPVDISRAALDAAARQAALDYPGLPVHAVWADFRTGFRLPLPDQGRIAGFFPGSSIGNFTRPQARHFLAGWRDCLGAGGAMIVGVDLIKPVAELEAAYDDRAGVTAAFTLNLLRRINRELDGDFQLSAFRHEAHYNPSTFAIDIHLVSRCRQTVTVCGQAFDFDCGERIHVESSHKYDVEGFQALAEAAGFSPQAVWTDKNHRFSIHFLTVAEISPSPVDA